MSLPNPVYTTNIPQPKNIIGNSQDQFLQNFQTLYNAFAANHIALDAVSGAGNHTVIQLTETPVTTNFQTNMNEVSLYAREVQGQTDQLFMRFEGNQPEFQFSNQQPTITHSPFVNTTFITFLPGNLVVFFGTVGAVGSISFNPYPLSNVVSATFCAEGTTPRNTPFTNLIKTGDKYTSINIPGNYYYFMIVGNP